MPNITSCPDCQRSIAIPSGTDAAQRLQCPRCGARFSAAQVLGIGVEAPPLVLFVDANEEAHAAPTLGDSLRLPDSPVFAHSPQPSALERLNAYLRESAAASGMANEEAPSTVAGPPERSSTEGVVASAEEPHSPQESAVVAASSLAAWITGRTGEGDEAPQPQWNRSVDDVRARAESPSAEAAAVADSSTEPGTPNAAAQANEEVQAGEEAPEASSDLAPAFGISAAPRRKRAQVGAVGMVGMVGNILGMALGAVIGLGMGYYILLWLGGARADFLEVRDKLPRWLAPPARSNHAQKGRRSAANNERSLAQRTDAPPETGADGAERPQTADPSAQAVAQREPVELVSGRAPLEEAAPAPVDPPLGPLHYSRYNTDQLADALNEVGSALGCEVCGGTGFIMQEIGGSDSAAIPRRARCPNCKGKASGTLTAAVFEKYCALAEIATFLDVSADGPQLDECRRAVQSMLVRLGADHDRAQIAGRLAGRHLSDTKRQGNGVILVGTVQEAAQEGKLFRTTLVLFGAPKTVTVLSYHAPEPAFAPRDQVAIMGSIIDNPRENIGGYSGGLSQVVWGGLPLKLAAAD